MRKVTVNRPQKFPFPFTKGKILIDGAEFEAPKAGKAVTFEVPDGNHCIQVIFASIPPTGSNELMIEASDGDTAFEVRVKVPVGSYEGTTAELTKL